MESSVFANFPVATRQILEPFHLSKDDCVGQVYDGASVMSGQYGGVQTFMKMLGTPEPSISTAPVTV